MIKTEQYELNGIAITRTHSDEGRYVVRDGIAYEEANDPSELNRQYTEGDPIETEPDAENIVNILMGNKS